MQILQCCDTITGLRISSNKKKAQQPLSWLAHQFQQRETTAAPVTLQTTWFLIEIAHNESIPNSDPEPSIPLSCIMFL